MLLGVLVIVLFAVSAGCGSKGGGATNGGTGGGSTTADAGGDVGGTTTTATSIEGVSIVEPAECGDPVVFQKSDPDGALADLPPDVQEAYGPYPFGVKASPWANFEGGEPPWTIGYVSFPIINPFKVNYYDELKKEVVEAKEEGLIDELKTYIQPSMDTATPEQQSAAIRQMVKDGVDGILLHPVNADAVTPAIDAAGEAGVPVVVTGGAAPNAEYAVNTLTQNVTPAITEMLKRLKEQGWFSGEKRTVLNVQGIPGNTYSELVHKAALVALKPCEGAEIIGTVTGNWSPASAKAETLKFLASYPGEIDFVLHEGAMAAGIIQAFESAGREVPPMPITGHTGGDLSWWEAHKDEYESVGVYTMGGRQVAYSTLRILMRIMNGNGLKVRDIAPAGKLVTNDNISELAVKGQPVTWLGDIRGPVDGWLSNDQMDVFFNEPGSPGGF